MTAVKHVNKVHFRVSGHFQNKVHLRFHKWSAKFRVCSCTCLLLLPYSSLLKRCPTNMKIQEIDEYLSNKYQSFAL